MVSRTATPELKSGETTSWTSTSSLDATLDLKVFRRYSWIQTICTVTPLNLTLLRKLFHSQSHSIASRTHLNRSTSGTITDPQLQNWLQTEAQMMEVMKLSFKEITLIPSLTIIQWFLTTMTRFVTLRDWLLFLLMWLVQPEFLVKLLLHMY